ncbi:MAG TPA: protein phosphatase 2C domain-containing protein [Phycisphaerae bacterium]|nr:protein phosphatase 2C domain-containing protein [Phycisphaerae bacterium]
MANATTDRIELFLNANHAEAETHPVADGTALVFSRRCPDKESPNEDAAALIVSNSGSAVLAVADGFGGQPAGEQASRIALESLTESVKEALSAGDTLRTGILDGFERANEAINAMGVGAATTMVAVEIDDGSVRPYHVGDSMALVVGQRGKTKLQTVSHSPVGYAVESGMLHEADALHHEDLHIVSNMLGSSEMRIEIGTHVQLRPWDTVLIASDGVFDNIPTQEVAELIRTGPLTKVAKLLAAECDQRMRNPREGQASKPDDLSFILFRLRG